MKKYFWPVIEEEIRDICPERCFYCGAALGKEHRTKCVCRTQTVVLRVTGKDGRQCNVISEEPEDWSLRGISRYMCGSGIQCTWRDLERHQVGKWGDSIQVLRFATHEDEDVLLNISSEVFANSSDENTPGV